MKLICDFAIVSVVFHMVYFAKCNISFKSVVINTITTPNPFLFTKYVFVVDHCKAIIHFFLSRYQHDQVMAIHVYNKLEFKLKILLLKKLNQSHIIWNRILYLNVIFGKRFSVIFLTLILLASSYHNALQNPLINKGIVLGRSVL